MLRHLVLFTTATLGLVLIGLACGAPGQDLPPDSPAAQATFARRTAVAEVQRIIANNPTATPLPAATSTPAPTCANAIWWVEARAHLGEARTLQGPVVGSRPAGGGLTLLEIGQPYPDPTGLAVIVPAQTQTSALDGKSLCVSGRIGLAEGQPTVQISDASAIVVLG